MARKSALDRYRECAAICQAIDYGRILTVRANNRAVDRMRRIVTEAGAVEELTPLLDDEEIGKWLAPQLLELCTVSPHIEQKCLAIIREAARDDGPEAMIAKVWLEDYRARRGSYT